MRRCKSNVDDHGGNYSKGGKGDIRGVDGKTTGVQRVVMVNEEVKKKIKEKNRRFKELMSCTEEEDRIHKNERYKEAKRATKKAVAEAKDREFEAFYQKLDTK